MRGGRSGYIWEKTVESGWQANNHRDDYQERRESSEKVIADVQRAVPDAEIVIVDSSSDRTAEIAHAMGAWVVKQFPPRGYGSAMDEALRSSGREVVVTLDCDDTYPVEFIEPMARMVLEDGHDLVDGSRLAGKPAAMPWINFLANWAFACLASLAATVFRNRAR